MRISTVARATVIAGVLALAASACSSTSTGSIPGQAGAGSGPSAPADLTAASKAEHGLVVYSNAASQLDRKSVV